MPGMFVTELFDNTIHSNDKQVKKVSPLSDSKINCLNLIW